MHPLVLIALVLLAAVIWVAGILLALIRLAQSQAEHRDITDGAAALNAHRNGRASVRMDPSARI